MSKKYNIFLVIIEKTSHSPLFWFLMFSCIFLLPYIWVAYFIILALAYTFRILCYILYCIMYVFYSIRRVYWYGSNFAKIGLTITLLSITALIIYSIDFQKTERYLMMTEKELLDELNKKEDVKQNYDTIPNNKQVEQITNPEFQKSNNKETSKTNSIIDKKTEKPLSEMGRKLSTKSDTQERVLQPVQPNKIQSYTQERVLLPIQPSKIQDETPLRPIQPSKKYDIHEEKPLKPIKQDEEKSSIDNLF